MDFKKEVYEIEFTEDAIDEIKEIYKYISENLANVEAAKRLMKKIKDTVMNLNENPKMYMKLEVEKTSREFRRMVIDNYVILYTIDDEKKIIYISHTYYGRRNYL